MQLSNVAEKPPAGFPRRSSKPPLFRKAVVRLNQSPLAADKHGRRERAEPRAAALNDPKTKLTRHQSGMFRLGENRSPRPPGCGETRAKHSENRDRATISGHVEVKPASIKMACSPPITVGQDQKPTNRSPGTSRVTATAYMGSSVHTAISVITSQVHCALAKRVVHPQERQSL